MNFGSPIAFTFKRKGYLFEFCERFDFGENLNICDCFHANTMYRGTFPSNVGIRRWLRDNLECAMNVCGCVTMSQSHARMLNWRYIRNTIYVPLSDPMRKCVTCDVPCYACVFRPIRGSHCAKINYDAKPNKYDTHALHISDQLKSNCLWVQRNRIVQLKMDSQKKRLRDIGGKNEEERNEECRLFFQKHLVCISIRIKHSILSQRLHFTLKCIEYDLRIFFLLRYLNLHAIKYRFRFSSPTLLFFSFFTP